MVCVCSDKLVLGYRRMKSNETFVGGDLSKKNYSSDFATSTLNLQIRLFLSVIANINLGTHKRP